MSAGYTDLPITFEFDHDQPMGIVRLSNVAKTAFEDQKLIGNSYAVLAPVYSLRKDKDGNVIAAELTSLSVVPAEMLPPVIPPEGGGNE